MAWARPRAPFSIAEHPAFLTCLGRVALEAFARHRNKHQQPLALLQHTGLRMPLAAGMLLLALA